MIIRGKEFAITKTLTEAEKQLGVDLKINQDGDLELNNLSDFKLIAGGANAAQAARLKLQIEPGGLVYHPAIGTDLQVGEKLRDAFAIKTQIVKSLTQDPRFENVSVRVQIDNSTIFVDIRMSIVNTGIEVPLQFVATEDRT